MISQILNSYDLTLDYLRRLVADVPDEDFARQPTGIPNHPAWIIGHLVHSCQALGGEIGLQEWLPAGWQKLFGTGSIPKADRSAYPTKVDLLRALADAQSRVSERLLAIGESAMNAQLPDERHRSALPTVGHAALHILAGHTAIHVGQISVWRRAADYQPLSEAAL